MYLYTHAYMHIHESAYTNKRRKGKTGISYPQENDNMYIYVCKQMESYVSISELQVQNSSVETIFQWKFNKVQILLQN